MKNLGEILKSQRKKRKLTYNQVYAKIKIHPNYIKALEENDYAVFDSGVHAKGFLKIYAELLNLNVSQILALWRREHSFTFEHELEKTKEQTVFEEIKQGFTLTTNKVLALIGIVLLVAFFGYLFYSYKNYSGPPDLKIDTPENNKIVGNSLVDITGKTDIDSVLFINGERVFLKPDGSFATSLHLKEGVNTLSITSINKLDKKTEEVLTVIYRPTEDSVLESTESTSPVSPEDLP
ncbi:hypothetical protein GF360_01670 [candidate division WWE3 bacterium]|nr:hypothetical protein [candidate division WWE3 bacterium]